MGLGMSVVDKRSLAAFLDGIDFSATLGYSPFSRRIPMERRLAAIMAADVVGYSRLMRVDEESTLARL